MNKREQIVVIFLSVTFISGALINAYKKWQQARKLASCPIGLNYSSPVLSDTLIDINTATAEQLDGLPGIGPILAQRIVAYREKRGGFKTINELRHINGIGPKRFAAIKDFITCKPFKPKN